MSQRIRPWFTETVYDAAENLKRRKQLIPPNKKLASFRLTESLNILYLSNKSFDSWIRLFPRKPPQWESRIDEDSGPADTKHLAFSRSVRVDRVQSRPELTMNKPVFAVPESLNSEFKS
jgi:hypothetical protein